MVDEIYKTTIVDVLQIVFITLKLTKLISWSWWWVMSPWLIGNGIILIVLGLGLLIGKVDK